MNIACVTFCLSALYAASLCCMAANLVPGGDFTEAKKGKIGWCRTEEGKFSLHNENYTWNNCGKLEVGRARTNNNVVTRSAIVSIGRDGRLNGFAVKPDTNYDFSIDVRNDPSNPVKSAKIRVMGWHGDDYWRDRRTIKVRSGANLSLESSWTTFRGSFRTPSDVKCAAIQLSFWSSSQGKLFEPGTFVLFDNVKVEESPNNLGAPSCEVKAELRKAVASGDAAFDDFVNLRTGTPSKAKTSVKVSAADGAFLFDVFCDEPLGVNVKEGGSAWAGDSLEIWFGRVGDERISTQLAIGSNGRKHAAVNGEKVSADIFDVRVECAAKSWKVRAKVPFAAFGWARDAKPGSRIAFNVGRCRRNARIFDTWSGLKSGFGDTANFGELVFDDYSAALKSRFGLDVVCKARSDYETKAAEARAAELNARFEKLKGRRFLAAQVPVTSDFSVPFLPSEIFDPPEEIRLSAAVNERKALPLAIANLVDRAEDYVVTLDDGSARNTGKFGLKGFPAAAVTMRKALRMKDSSARNPTLRFDPLPEADGTGSVSVPPKEAGLVWFDFDTARVAPGIYTGRLNIIPLGGYGKFNSGKGGFHDISYSGEMQSIAVTLEVLPIELPVRAAAPTGFFMGGLTEEAFGYQVQLGAEYFNLTPWNFIYGKDEAGNLDLSRPEKNAVKMKKTIAEHLKWGGKLGIRPQFLVCYSTVDIFRKLYNPKKDPEKDRKLWPQFVLGIKKLMNECGVSDAEYAIETYDEPPSDGFAEMLSFHKAAKAVAPTVRLEITLGHHKMKMEEYVQLGEVTDEWIVWDNYFLDKPYREFFANQQKLGKSVRHYTCETSPRVDLDQYYRKKAWFGEKYGLDGNCMYQFCDTKGGLGARDFKIPTFGNIIYFHFGKVVPSVRYMAFREGITDLKYFAKLRETAPGDPAVEKFISEAVDKALGKRRHDPREPDRLRELAAKMILERTNNK